MVISLSTSFFRVGLCFEPLQLGAGSGPISKKPFGNLVIDELTPTALYAGTEGRGVFTSTNGGNSWSAINSGLTRNRVVAFAIEPLTPTTVYAGTDGGVFKSTDAGASWVAMWRDCLLRGEIL